MVNKEFIEFNNKFRKKLISLYEIYIENPKSKLVIASARELCGLNNFIFSEDVSIGLSNCYDIIENILTIERAKEILKELKKEEIEDK